MTVAAEAPGAAVPPQQGMVRRFRPLWGYPAQQRGRLAVIAAVTVGSSFAAAWQPLPFKLLVDNGIGGQPVTGWPASALDAVGLGDISPRGIIVLSVALAFLASLFFAALSAGLAWEWERAGQGMVGALMKDMHAKCQRLSMRYHLRRDTGDTLSRLQWDSQSIYTITSAVLIAPAVCLLTMTTVGWSAWRQSQRLTVVILLLAPVLGAVSAWYGPRLRSRARATREAQSAISSFVTQTMHAMPIVQSFAAEDRNIATFRNLAGDAVAKTRREAFTTAMADSLSQLVSTSGSALVLVVGGREVLQGRMSLGSLLVFTSYTRTLQNQAQSLMSVYRTARTTEASLDRVMDIVASDEEIPEPAEPALAPKPAQGAAIVLDGVSVGYEPGAPVLHDIDLSIAPGECVAIVGRTGAGKSTLVSLIPRLLDVWDGTVAVAGVDVRDYAVADLRRRVAVVRQDPILVPASIAENIAYGRPDAPREAIERAAQEALATEFIEDLPEGYDTVLGERGMSLSGGQRQRLAIARALLKDAPVLILDEPTSALDARSERAIVDVLEHLKGHRTVLVIAHRLSTVRHADRIVALADGRIAEVGTHDELIAAQGVYARLYALQFAEVEA